MCEKEDQSATGTTKEGATLGERYLVSGARLKIYTLFPKDKLKEFDGMSFARQLLYAHQQQSLKSGVESKIQDGVQDPFQERGQDPWKGKQDATLRGQEQPLPMTRRWKESRLSPQLR